MIASKALLSARAEKWLFFRTLDNSVMDNPANTAMGYARVHMRSSREGAIRSLADKRLTIRDQHEQHFSPYWSIRSSC